MPNAKIKVEALHVRSPEGTIHKKLGSTNFSSNLHILGTRGINETCSILRTCNSGLTCEPVIWCFLLGACELIHVTLCKKKINIYTENIR